MVTDPDIPPLVSAKEARDDQLAVAKGYPEAIGIVRKSIRQMLA